MDGKMDSTLQTTFTSEGPTFILETEPKSMPLKFQMAKTQTSEQPPTEKTPISRQSRC